MYSGIRGIHVYELRSRHVSPSTLSYPGVGMCRVVARMCRGGHHPAIGLCSPSLLPEVCGSVGGGETRFEMYGVRGQLVKISSDV